MFKRTDPVQEAPKPGGVWGRIIEAKPYPCTVQCREAVSNPGPLGTSGEYLCHCASPVLQYESHTIN
jgi:hypothetical protein